VTDPACSLAPSHYLIENARRGVDSTGIPVSWFYRTDPL